jgi:PAS domain S-box-containing protein
VKAWLRRRSLRTRLLGVIVAVILLAIGTFGGIALVAEQRAAREALVSEQAALATLVANRSAAALLFGDVALAQENMAALGGIPHVQAACLYDMEGRLFTSFTVDGALACTERKQDAATDARWALVAEVPVEMDEVLGAMVLRSSLEPVTRRLAEQATTWAAAGAVGALLALVLAAVLERLISAPIRRLGAIAESIATGEARGDRAPIEGDDEVAQLAGAFNRMLDRLDEQARRLQLQADYNQVLFKQSPLPVIVIDPRQRGIVDCNDAAIEISGRGTREEALRTSVGEVSAPRQYDGTPSEIAIVPYIRAALAGQPQVYDWRHRRPDGSEFDAEVHLTRFGPEEAPLLLGSLFDVTERKQAAAALQRMNEVLESRVAERTRDLASSNAELSAAIEQLQRTRDELVRSDRLASLGSMVAGVAHELNTPLGSALLVATTLGEGIEELRAKLERGELKRSSLDDFLAQQAEAQSLIVRNARRAAELIGRFKQVAVDQTSEQRRRFDLAEVVEEVLDTLQPRLRQGASRLAIDIPRGIALESYPGPLGQVLTNLVMNAMIHGLGERGGEIRVSGRAVGEADVELRVEDNGVGIPAEHLSRIFDPFFTTRLGEGGSGLGLHIAYSLVQRSLGGRIAVESAPGEGARFIVTLPLVAPQSEAD